MANSGGKITAPVSFADVNYVLGSNKTDLGQLCKLSNINKWARFKPVKHSAKGILTMAQRLSTWCGFNGYDGVPFITNTERLMNYTAYQIIMAQQMAGSQTFWVYNKPSGGTNSPYRLSDFVEKPNDATTPPWVGSLHGYNHNASFPVKVTIGKTGVRKNGSVYEVNLQLAASVGNVVTWTIENQGDDLCIQDFCDFGVEDSDCKWRPIVQLFYPNGTTPWYNVDRPTATAGGTQITASRSTAHTVSLSTTSKIENQTYYACIGIGCANASGSYMTSRDNNLFILPYDVNKSDYWLTQFYYQLRFVNYFTNNIKVTQVRYPTLSGYKQATNSGGSQSFVVGSDITSGDLQVAMEIDRTDIDLYFVDEHSSLSVTPKFYIAYDETIDPNVSKYFYPLKADWTNPAPYYIKIDADPNYADRKTPLKQTVCAHVANGIRGSVTYFSYHMKTQIGTAGLVDVNTFSIRKSS